MTLLPGARLGPYEIRGSLGAGGMGEVYRARDTRLGRDVAVKVLPKALSSDRERLARFEKEARSASALNHPNIITVHDVGQEEIGAYLAMELVEGVTLRDMLVSGPLTLARTLAIAAQAAEGLAAAHEAGIVHRDLKPENVMLRRDGLVKILDFGLARSTSRSDDSPEARQAPTQTGLTEPGVVMGTVGYMSPEQAAGRPVDFRSDQFSLAAILYEMVTGRRAFQRGTAVETLSAIIREEPPPIAQARPETPEPLRWVVERCLAKEPEERYGSTRDLARDLARLRDRPAESALAKPGALRAGILARGRWLVAAAILAGLLAGTVFFLRARSRREGAAQGQSIAILPFQNLSGQREGEYFSDGMTEALITDLARVPGLLVIARNSVFQYKGRTADVRKVGKELGVRYVLEGSVQRAEAAVRVNAQLVDTRTGYHVWADRYDRPTKDLFALQDDISKNVIESLKVALRPEASVRKASSPTPDLEAYELYLRGLYQLYRLELEERVKAIPLLEKAVARDPSFARARGLLAAAYARKAFEGDPQGIWRGRAEEEIEKALTLDAGLPEPYLARASLAWSLKNGFPHEKAAADYRRALELSPNLQPAHKGLASIYYHVGLLEEGLAQYRLAARLDPKDLDAVYRIPRILLYQQKHEEALAGFDQTPEFRADFLKPIALAQLGKTKEALELARRELTNPTHTKAVERADAASTLAVILALTGDPAGAQENVAAAVRDGEGNSHFHHAAYNIATTYAVLGEREQAVQWLERVAREGMPCFPLFERDPLLDRLRDGPQFAGFLSRQKAQFERLRAVLLR